MPLNRTYPSVTIPPGFRFHYHDGQMPRTPEPGESHELHEAPPAPRQSSRRKTGERPGIPRFSPPAMLTALHNVPIPTIEQPPPEPVPEPVSLFTRPQDGQFLGPQLLDLGVFAPPKTPAPQINQNDSMDYFDMKSQGESISRPSTACSDFSDSSMSSADEGSLESFPSLGGGSVSPETENTDPFIAKQSSSQESLVSSPLLNYQGPPKARIRTSRKFVWTEVMDRHLWRTFMLYLNDPEHTPFKLFPGTHPPLGVCHRVAREAKRTWRSAKSHDVSTAQGRQMMLRTGSPDTIRQLDGSDDTPTASGSRTSVAQWPPNATTRRRLRELCKSKPSLSAHYQRLMQNRSPSPFESSSSSGRTKTGLSSEANKSTQSSFNTRDMNVSLVASTSSAMRSSNPLSELTVTPAEASQPMEDTSVRPISRGGAHQKSLSLQLGIEAVPKPADFRMLASPFQPHPQYSTWSSRQRSTLAQPANHSQTVRTLAPAAELHSPAPLPRTLKRRARMDTNESRTSNSQLESDWLQDVFGAPAESSHRRVRSRGFSLGDMNEAPRFLSIFTPPSETDNNRPEPPVFNLRPATQSGTRADLTGNTTSLAPPMSDVPPRLGSPFAPHVQEKPYNTMPRLASPAQFEPALSFEERLSAFAPGRVSKTGGRSFNRSRGNTRPSLAQFLCDQREQH